MNAPNFVLDNRRWLSGALALTFFSGAGQTFFIALFAGDIRADHGLTHGGFGLVYMVATLASAATLVTLGRVVDRFEMRAVASATVAALCVACVLMATARSIPALLLAIYALRLFGQGMMSHVAMTAMGRWFDARRGRAVSIAALGHQLGEGTLPLLVVLATPLVGWRNLWLAAAALLLTVALPSVRACWSVSRTPQAERPVARERGRQWTRAEVLRDRPFSLVCTAVLAPAFIGTSVFFHQVHLAEVKRWSPTAFAGAFVLLASVTIVAGLGSGRLIDRVGAWRLLPYFLVPLGSACVVLALGQSPWVAWAFMGLLGLSYGLSSSIFGALWPELYGVRHLGAIRSLVFAAMVLASAVGPGVTGWLIDLGVGIELQLLGMGAYCAVAAVAMVPTVRLLGLRLGGVPA